MKKNLLTLGIAAAVSSLGLARSLGGRSPSLS